MPVIRHVPCSLSARQVLYSRCPLCEYRLVWRTFPNKEDISYATCCDFWFTCTRQESQPHEFLIDGGDIDFSNVFYLK